MAPSVRGTHAALALALQLTVQSRPPRVLVLTCGTQAASTGASHASSDAAHGGVWGFARVLRLEHAGLRTQSADLSRGAHAAAAMRSSLSNAAEAEVAWCDETRCVSRLRRSSAGASSTKRDASVARGLYAITGGLGGLGLRAGALLVERGATRLLLASRSGRVMRDGQGLGASLRALGLRAAVVACDNADSCDSSALLACGGPVSGILHAAGVSDRGLMTDIEADKMQWMMASKAFGAWYLHCAMVAWPVETRVLYSSVGSGLGNLGHGN